MRRVLIALAAVAVVGGATAATAAPPVPPVPVGVTHNSDGSVCVTISYQLPHCTPGIIR